MYPKLATLIPVEFHFLETCGPQGFDKVEIPGEPERDSRAADRAAGISLPEKTWGDIEALERRLAAHGYT